MANANQELRTSANTTSLQRQPFSTQLLFSAQLPGNYNGSISAIEHAHDPSIIGIVIVGAITALRDRPMDAILVGYNGPH